jgi:hypothetical protein
MEQLKKMRKNHQRQYKNQTKKVQVMVVNNFLYFSVYIFIFEIDEDNQSFKSARPSVQDLSPSPSVTQSAATPTVNQIISFFVYLFLFRLNPIETFH